MLLVATVAIHIALVPEHLREAPYAGILFAALSASALTMAAVLLARDQAVMWASAAGLSLTAIARCALSRSVGLPAMSDDIGDWLNSLGVGARQRGAHGGDLPPGAARFSRRRPVLYDLHATSRRQRDPAETARPGGGSLGSQG